MPIGFMRNTLNPSHNHKIKTDKMDESWKAQLNSKNYAIKSIDDPGSMKVAAKRQFRKPSTSIQGTRASQSISKKPQESEIQETSKNDQDYAEIDVG